MSGEKRNTFVIKIVFKLHVQTATKSPTDGRIHFYTKVNTERRWWYISKDLGNDRKNITSKEEKKRIEN